MCVHHDKEAFATEKDGELEQQTFILKPILARIPKHINTCFLEIIRVQTLREGGSLLGFSLFNICFIFRFRFLRFRFFCEFFGL